MRPTQESLSGAGAELATGGLWRNYRGVSDSATMPTVRTLGRFLQVVGLVIPLSGIFLAESSIGMQSMTFSFGGLFVGAIFFYVGWRMQGMSEG